MSPERLNNRNIFYLYCTCFSIGLSVVGVFVEQSSDSSCDISDQTDRVVLRRRNSSIGCRWKSLEIPYIIYPQEMRNHVYK